MFIIFGIASQKWPTTEALITESDLKNGTTGFGTKAYWPIVKYNYQIGDEKFIGKRIAFGKYGTKWNNTYKKEIARIFQNDTKLDNPHSFIICHSGKIFQCWKQDFHGGL